MINKNTSKQNFISVFLEVENDSLTKEIQSLSVDSLDTALADIFPNISFALDLTFTNDKKIFLLNKEFRGIDNATDVLSFPQYEFFSPYEPAESFIYEGGAVQLGDIIISVETALRQADEYNHSLKREIVFLCIHSLLHLLGHDHIDTKERVRMEEEQQRLMKILKITR